MTDKDRMRIEELRWELAQAHAETGKKLQEMVNSTDDAKLPRLIEKYFDKAHQHCTDSVLREMSYILRGRKTKGGGK